MYDPMRRIYEDMPALKYKVELSRVSMVRINVRLSGQQKCHVCYP